MAKKKIKFPIFVITLVIGLGLIVFALYEADFDVGTLTNFQQLTSFSILDVPIDPTTGGILGTIVFGAPDVIPFEQAGTVSGIPFSQSRNASPRSFCTDNFLALDGIGTTKDSSLALTDPNDFGRAILMPPDFERRLSGERNQIDPVWWGSKLTDNTVFPLVSGVATYTCGFAYAQWDIVDIPNDFVVTSAVLKLKVLEIRKASNETFQIATQQCTITLQDFNLDTIADEGIMNKVWKVGGVSTPLTIATGTWCNTLGVRSFQLSQSAVDLINDAISGGAFGQGTRADKLLMGFMPTRLNNEAQAGNVNRISTEFWKTEGSLFLTGSSPPIRCGVGFNQVDFRCIPIVCVEGESVNPDTNQCEPIRCAGDEQLIGNICTPIICNVGEQVIGGACIPIQCGSSDHLVGSECVPLICDVGFEAKQNQCVVKTCSIGNELVNDNCQAIVCPINTFLNGNDCVELTCAPSETIYNNECRDTVQLCDLGIFACDPPDPPILECPTGYDQVGANCVFSPDNCPEGTEPFENNCRQIVPDLLMISGISPSLFLILGLVIAGMSGVGIVARRRG